MGTLYKRGETWWIKYYVNSQPQYESAKTDKKSEAERLLKEREGRIAAGLPMLARADKIRYEEVAEDLRKHYETTGRRKLDEAEMRLKHLGTFFTGRRVMNIGPATITEYIDQRQSQGASNGTINRELAVLGRMLRVAYVNNKLARLPVIEKLKESAPRSGFFERHQFEAVRRHLRPDLQVAVTIGYTYGWRIRSEVLVLDRRHVDLEAGTLRLDPGMTKNDEGRVVYLTPESKVLLTQQLERVDRLTKTLGRIVPCLFPYQKGRYRGERIKEFRKAWATACKRAGCPGMLRHDFRRTAVRNMVNAGIPERVAMKITGHKTRAVFDRYHIVSPGDLQEAAKRLAGADGYKTVTIGGAALDRRSVSV